MADVICIFILKFYTKNNLHSAQWHNNCIYPLLSIQFDFTSSIYTLTSIRSRNFTSHSEKDNCKDLWKSIKSKLWGISRCYSQKQYFLFHVECCMICKPVIIVEWFYLYLFILYDPDDWYVNYFNVYQSSPCKSIMVMAFL